MTEITICRELDRDLPTVSVKDTEQSKEEFANFFDTYYSICGSVLGI